MLRDLIQNIVVSINFKDLQFVEDYIFKVVMFLGVRKLVVVLKFSDWEKFSNGWQWKFQFGFNCDWRFVYLDQVVFRILGYVMLRGLGIGIYSNVVLLFVIYQGNLYRLFLRG